MPPGRLRKPLWEISGRAGYFSADCGDWTARGLRNPPDARTWRQSPVASPAVRLRAVDGSHGKQNADDGKSDDNAVKPVQ